MIKVGINGFGRIGRLILRALLENYKGKIQVVGINDLGSVEANAHLIKFDSTHGTLTQSVKTSSEGFQIGDQKIKVFAEKDPAKLPWSKIGADVVLECTGFFLDKTSAGKHISAGAKKVIISAPAKEVDFTVVQGVNSKDLKKEHDRLSGEVIPTMMAEMGLSHLKLADGSTVDVKANYSANISVANREKAFNWLRENGLGDIIKNEISVSFGRNEDNKAADYAALAEERGYQPTQKLKVEPMTLKALVRERLEAGKSMPTEIFNVFVGNKTTIKRNK